MTPTQVAELCLQLPGAHESIKWSNNRVFSIADNKMFALLSFPAKGRESLAFKVDNDLFLAFTDRPGIRPAPYLARARWVSMEAPFPLPDVELRAALIRSHQLVVMRLARYRQAAFRVVEDDVAPGG
ncbi:MmcQ/YjbR family DNA-binding protein [Zoogloea sp.]|uniref:MmcQ/YjbR family DNA-binding protein n=1 Tax=Zoogloea sp. TaxID=49181 RepID=UPI001AC64B50|nr:MmcQ/YjbR family DNA-binding protein [Zoogloea sp.]MBN8284853.1 MmcQ/YjbR family DNA-binding protein [Zoogloea sp.]